MTTIPTRAAPLPPDERRAALVAATLPLVRAHGRQVSTRQIAEAAGVAEGTIFRVFASKDELVDAAVSSAFDPAPLVTELRRVDRDLPLDERLEAAAGAMQRQLEGIFHLIGAVGMSRPPEGHGTKAHPGRHDAVVGAIAELLAPAAASLTCEPREAARRLRLLTFAGTHPIITDGLPMTPREIVSTLLDGVRRHDSPATRRGAR